MTKRAPTRAIALIFDITSRREAQISLSLENQHKDEFLAMLGHEAGTSPFGFVIRE